jgi:tRNA uridine 5-carboxymethylaminomethyl modification enzyme
MFEARRSRLDNNLRILDQTLVRSAEGGRVPASQMLKRPEVRLAQMVSDRLIALEIDEHRAGVDIASAETSIKYAGYLRRQESEIERGRRDERRRIPMNFPFDQVPGLSREVVQRLSQVRPDTLGHALRIPGVTPAAVAVLSAYVGRFPAVSQ